jgi:uncharacterized LabA/DUF88 family protein
VKTVVYIDAFNLYYGSLKGSDLKWLDLNKLMPLILPKHQVIQIRYFTAKITPKKNDRTAPLRQKAYLDALGTLPNVSIHFGRYQTKEARMPLAYPIAGQPKIVVVLKTEEKGSDVNLATHLLVDAYAQLADHFVVISNDADLAEPIRVVRHDLNLNVGIINPHAPKERSWALSNVNPTFHWDLRKGVLRASQFPSSISAGGKTIQKPTEWA